jgi:Helix-turn-helix of DDE superfamily endonuclease
MFFYRAALPFSRPTLDHLAGVVRRHRRKIGSCWRKLNPGQQALLVLVHLRKGETFAELAAGFGVGIATAWRYVQEAAVYDLIAVRIWGIVRRLAAAGLIVPADKGYIGAGDHVITPYRGRNKPASQKAANRARASLRAPPSGPMPSSSPGTSCASCAAASGATDSSPRQFTSFKPVRSPEKRSMSRLFGDRDLPAGQAFEKERSCRLPNLEPVNPWCQAGQQRPVDRGAWVEC